MSLQMCMLSVHLELGASNWGEILAFPGFPIFNLESCKLMQVCVNSLGSKFLLISKPIRELEQPCFTSWLL